MSLFLSTAVLALLATVTEPAGGLGLAVSEISANHGKVWQTKKTGDSTQAFLTLHNDGTAPDTVTNWSCTIAASTTLVGPDGKPLQNLVIPAGKTVTLTANGPHLSLQSLRFTVDNGSLVPCTLSFGNDQPLGVLLYASPPAQ